MVPSVEPSSTNTTSQSRPNESSTGHKRSTRGGIERSSLSPGTITDSLVLDAGTGEGLGAAPAAALGAVAANEAGSGAAIVTFRASNRKEQLPLCHARTP